MFKSLITATVVGLSVLATGAQAYSLVSTEELSGVIASVNVAEKTLSVKEDNGQVRTFLVAEKAKILVQNGGKFSLDALEAGHNVVVKRQVLTQANAEIKGSLVAVDAETRTIKVRDAQSKQVVALQLDPSAVIKGTEENSLKSLKKGQYIVLRGAAI